MRLSRACSRNCSLPPFLPISTYFSPPRASPSFSLPRSYATETNLEENSWPTQSSPTPYQIFNTSPKDPYSKRKYFELVKLYHPDHRHHHPNIHIPESIRLERFRLVVTANAILSDPVKRRAYDRSGAGWTSAPIHSLWAAREGHMGMGSGFTGYGKGGSDDPAGNATWEDWEKWYQRRAHAEGKADAPEQKELYMSNSMFLAIVIMFAALGGLMNVNHARETGSVVVEEVDKKNKEIGRKLGTVNVGTKEERVERFLRNRDPYAYVHTVGEREGRERMLLEGERRVGLAEVEH